MLARGILLLATVAIQATVAINPHRHLHRLDKKALVVETETVTDYVVVTVDPESPASPASSSHVYLIDTHPPSKADTPNVTSSVVQPTPPEGTPAPAPPVYPPPPPAPSTSDVPLPPLPPSPPPPPTTSSAAPAPSPPAAPPPPPVDPTPPPSPLPELNNQNHAVENSPSNQNTPPSKPIPQSSGRTRRGLAYNDPHLLSVFIGKGAKCDWKVNWDQTDDSKDVPVEFVPMLWGLNPDHLDSWPTNAQKAIDAGATHLLSFNEPDLVTQANLNPWDAANGHQKFMNPLAKKAKIGTPAITNSPPESGAYVGLNWLKTFVQACDGKCAMDYAAFHWYNLPNATEFIQHAKAVSEAAGGLPVWATEFATVQSSPEETEKFVSELLHMLDTDPSLAFIERIAYFMVTPGSLLQNGVALSSIGKLYAFDA